MIWGITVSLVLWDFAGLFVKRKAKLGYVLRFTYLRFPKDPLCFALKKERRTESNEKTQFTHRCFVVYIYAYGL